MKCGVLALYSISIKTFCNSIAKFYYLWKSPTLLLIRVAAKEKKRGVKCREALMKTQEPREKKQ